MFGFMNIFRRRAKAQVQASVLVPRVVRISAKYDAAQTTDNNRRHWANADNLSADCALSPDVRRTLRNRARYESANNSYCRGIGLTITNDLVGRGPRLQFIHPDIKSKDRSQIEWLFAAWARKINLADKLRTVRLARYESGEAFMMFVLNEALESKVKLDIQVIESDQIGTREMTVGRSNAPGDGYEVDGIRYDQWDNPVSYAMLPSHPGETGSAATMGAKPEWIPAAYMLHYYRADRPGQSRGIPDITPALGLFSQLRRFALATLGAAEVAASHALVVQSDAPAMSDEQDDLEPLDTIELNHLDATVLPGGWKLGQFKAEHPATTHVQFKDAILGEIARCLNVTFNVASGNSSGYNFASGRLDHQIYFKNIEVDRDHMERVILDQIVMAWFHEAVLIEGYLPQVVRTTVFYTTLRENISGVCRWMWDGREHVDPLKEANATAVRLKNRMTTYSRECAKSGDDWEEVFQQLAREESRAKELGLDLEQVASAIAHPQNTEDPNEEEV